MFRDQLELDRGKQSLICPAGQSYLIKKFEDQLELDRGKQSLICPAGHSDLKKKV